MDLSMSTSLRTADYVVWWVVLIVVTVVIVPLAILLLHRTLRAALSIRRYMREMLQAGVGIATNTNTTAAVTPRLRYNNNAVMLISLVPPEPTRRWRWWQCAA